MKLPKDIRDLIMEFKYSLELNERHQRLITELEINIFFKYVKLVYEMFLNIT